MNLSKRIWRILKSVIRRTPEYKEGLESLAEEQAALEQKLRAEVALKDERLAALAEERQAVARQLEEARGALTTAKTNEEKLNWRHAIGVSGDAARVERDCAAKCKQLLERLAEIAEERAELTAE
jgi:hypothetical protein